MPAPLSLDLRIRIVDAYEEGGVSQEEVAKRFAVGVATVARLIALKRRTGSLEPSPNVGGHSRRKIHAAGEELIIAWLKAEPEMTTAHLTERFNERTRANVSVTSMNRTLHRLGLTRKQRLS